MFSGTQLSPLRGLTETQSWHYIYGHFHPVHARNMSLNPHTIASNWLSASASALQNADVGAFADLFLSDGWLRDLIVFTWDVRCLSGREKISAYLAPLLSTARITNLRLDETAHLAPSTFPSSYHKATGVEFAFVFDCQHGHGNALVRLIPDADGQFRAFTLLTQLSGLPGQEELNVLPWRDDVTGIAERDMQNDFQKWVESVESDPYAIIGMSSEVCYWLSSSHCLVSSRSRPDRSSNCSPIQADGHQIIGD